VTWVFERLSGPEDLEGVLAVDEACFNQPWTRQDYERELADPARCFIHIVRGPGGLVLAYCSFWRIVDEIHINNFAVRPEWRRQGLGTALIHHVLAEGRRLGAPNATLEVRRSNSAAIRLYERAGFRRAGERRHFYANPLEDALILWHGPAPAHLEHDWWRW
jgi:[ribosomal protein S18]-alanine N-acetyltransferase